MAKHTKKKNSIVKLKIVVEKLQKSLLLGLKRPEHEHEEIIPEDVKEGHFAVTAMEGNELKRFIIPLNFLRNPRFVGLLEQAEEEYGFDHNGALTIPCRPSEIERILNEQWSDVVHSNVGVIWGSCNSMVQSF